MRDVASWQEATARCHEIAQPEHLSIRDEEHPLVGTPCLHTQQPGTVTQQRTLDKGQQAFVIEQKICERLLKALGDKADEMLRLGMRASLAVLKERISLQLKTECFG